MAGNWGCRGAGGVVRGDSQFHRQASGGCTVRLRPGIGRQTQRASRRQAATDERLSECRAAEKEVADSSPPVGGRSLGAGLGVEDEPQEHENKPQGAAARMEARPRRPRHFPLAARPRPPKSAAAQVAEPPAGDPAQLLPRLSPSPAMPRGCVCPHPRVQCSTGSFLVSAM